MKNEIISVANAKKRLSEVINQTAYSARRIIITKRNRPIAAVIDIIGNKKMFVKSALVLKKSQARQGLI